MEATISSFSFQTLMRAGLASSSGTVFQYPSGENSAARLCGTRQKTPSNKALKINHTAVYCLFVVMCFMDGVLLGLDNQVMANYASNS